MDVPGDYLGTYGVQASLVDSTCGGGTLAPPTIWEFEVQLSKDENHLYWTNGAESIKGELSDDGTIFGFTTEVATTLKEAKPGRPGCVIWRQDAANGTLTLGAGGDGVPSFDGKLSYTYAPGPESQCEEQAVEAGIVQLPCVIRFGLSGTRMAD